MLSSAKKRYLLTVYELGQNGNEVFSKDIAASLNVKRPSVSKMLKSMEEENLFCKESYGKVQLSENGARIANRLYTNYLLLFTFFCEHLKVSRKDARHDAIVCLCDLSEDSAEKIASLVLED
jgi:DtxR family Mn-dependent transcriptional regulator